MTPLRAHKPHTKNRQNRHLMNLCHKTWIVITADHSHQALHLKMNSIPSCAVLRSLVLSRCTAR